MLPGECYVDLRDRTVVRLRRVLWDGKEEPPLVEVEDIPRGFTFVMDSKFLSPRAVETETILDWLKHG
jgi:hypothetical protein